VVANNSVQLLSHRSYAYSVDFRSEGGEGRASLVYCRRRVDPYSMTVSSGATLRVDAGGSLYSPQMWQIDEHQKLPAYTWDPYTTNSKL
jgi:hypothetical protein